MSKEMLNLLQDLMVKAKSLGATQADAVLTDSYSVAVNRRFGKSESLRRSEEAEIGLRVFVGKRSAIVSSSDRAPAALAQMAERAVAMAKSVPEDPYAGVADPSELATVFPNLDLFDPHDLSIEEMNELADRAEQAARDVKGITNSDGAEFGYGKDIAYYVASNGFAHYYASSGFNLSVSVIAGQGTAMETDYDFDSAAWFSDLEAPEAVGERAGERAVKALNPRKGATRKLPVIFDRRISGGVLGSFSSAISGAAVARGTTMLKDKMGEMVFNPRVMIVDDPFMPRGPRSHPFDGEGVAPTRRALVEGGRLTGWILDLSSARQLGLKTTGNAARGAGGPPSPRASNLLMLPGEQSVDDMIGGIDEGFFVTQRLGGGGNIITGDYSSGARGFWIEKGKLAYPVSEMTIAGNLKDMWRDCTPANDLQQKYGIDAPTLHVGTMMVAGT